MKSIAVCCLLLLGVVFAEEIGEHVSNLHANIQAIHDFHSSNVAEAHATVMALDLQAHFQELLASLNAAKPALTTQGQFRPQLQVVDDCIAAATSFAQVVNGGCNAVFAIFNNTFTNVQAGHNLMNTHCVGAQACHVSLSASIATLGRTCAPALPFLPGTHDTFIQQLKALIVLTEMPCITDDADPTKFCFEDVIALRSINSDPGTGTQGQIPSDATLNQYCTRCIFKLFAAASTFAPDAARLQFALMAANCWQFPMGGPYCIHKFAEVVNETQAEQQAENGTSIAHLDRMCHPCVRIFMRRVAIIYADPIFQGKLLAASQYLFRTIHTLDAVCLARGIGEYCVRELMPSINAGDYRAILPIPGYPCYESLVNGAGNTCPSCGVTIANLTTQHGCCAIALYRLAGLALALNNQNTLSTDNRDDPTFPSNKMVTAFNTKCTGLALAIDYYCTAVAVSFRITLFNIVVSAYLARQAVFHALLIHDIAEFLGMVAADIDIPQTGVAVQGTNTPWYSGFVPASFVTQDASQGVAFDINIYPDNANTGDQINSYLSQSLATGGIPFPNTASDVSFVADPTVQVTAAQSSASTVVASVLLLVVLALFQL